MALYNNVLINGGAFTPSGVEVNKPPIGVPVVKDSGKRDFVQRVTPGGQLIFKRVWTLTWDGVVEAIRTSIEALTELGTTFSFRDLHGGTYTVQIEGDSYTEGFQFRSAAGDLYYGVTLKLYEA